jgi:hypothetical protein
VTKLEELAYPSKQLKKNFRIYFYAQKKETAK